MEKSEARQTLDEKWRDITRCIVRVEEENAVLGNHLLAVEQEVERLKQIERAAREAMTGKWQIVFWYGTDNQQYQAPGMLIDDDRMTHLREALDAKGE